jgi:hypothetical protein
MGRHREVREVASRGMAGMKERNKEKDDGNGGHMGCLAVLEGVARVRACNGDQPVLRGLSTHQPCLSTPWRLYLNPPCSRLLPQVHIICREALEDCPSCAPALDTLAQYYLACTCLAAQHLQQHSKHKQGQGPPQQQAAHPATGEAVSAVAGEQQQDPPAAEPSKPASSSAAAATAAAVVAVQAAGSAALQVLDKLLIADGIRGAYWHHRRREVEEVLAACSSFKAV